MNIVKKGNIDKLFFFCLCLMIISFPFSGALNSILTAVLFLFFLADFKYFRESINIYLNNKKNIFLLIIFISLLSSLIYSHDKYKGWDGIVKYSALLSIPLSLTKLKNLTARQVKTLKILFVLVCLIASVICLIGAIKNSGIIDGSYRELAAPELHVAYIMHRLTYHQLSGELHLHAVYFSLFISVSFFILLFDIKANSRFRKITRVLLFIYLLIFLVLLKSIIINVAFYIFLLTYFILTFTFKKWGEYAIVFGLAIISSAVCCYLFILKYIGQFETGTYLFDSPDINSKIAYSVAIVLVIASLVIGLKLLFKKKYIQIIVILSCLTAVVALWNFNKTIEAEVLKGKVKISNTNNITSRSLTWAAAWSIIEKDPIWGAGIGDKQAKMNEHYKEMGFETGIRSSFNAHNQYLEFWIAGGLLAFLCFITLIIYEFYRGYHRKNYVYMGFIFSFGMLCLSESAANTQLGRTFFLFFIFILETGYNNHLSTHLKASLTNKN